MIEYIIVNDFANWLNEELRRRDWQQVDLARKANIGNSTLSRILSGTRPAGPDVCRKIARAFGYPAEEVFRHAGLLPSPAIKEESEIIGQLNQIVSQLPEVDQKEVLAYAEYRYRQRQQGDESPVEAIQMLGAELERLFGLISKADRKKVLTQALQDRYMRDAFSRILEDKRP